MNYLYFQTAAVDDTASGEEVAMFPADKLLHVEAATSTTLRCYFDSMQEVEADGVNKTVIVLTIASGKHKEVCKAIALKANASIAADGGYAVIADALNNDFCSSHITSLTIDVIDAS